MKTHPAAAVVLCTCAFAMQAMADDALAAFPGAQGYGAASVGGRGGRVIHVTSLADDGPGSFRAAVAETGPRIIVFDVGGTVDLHSELDMPDDGGRVTIAGQTAPGGITFIGGTLALPGWSASKKDRTADIIVRHIRVRGVHGHGTHAEGGDCLNLYKSQRAILDHCSFTGSTDETVDAIHSKDLTMQWCTIEEPALWGQGNNQHDEGDHNYGFIFSYDAANVSCHHNLFVHSSNRNPLITKGPGEIRNNVVYNFMIGFAGGGTDSFNLVGNTFKTGPDRPTWVSPFYYMQEGRFYFADNAIDFPEKAGVIHDLAKDCPGFRGLSWRAPGVALDKPIEIPFAGKADSSADAMAAVLARAGAWPRDATTRRCIAELKTRTGGYGIGGPYERFASRGDGPTSAKLDTDRDGMPDAWETAHGLDPKDPADGNRLVPRGASPADRHAGYTWVEFCLNELADAIVGADGPLATVEVAVEGAGHVGCSSGGWTAGWHSDSAPREVFWGGPNALHKGSTVVLKALPAQGHLFSHFSGGSVDGAKDARVELKVDGDVKVTAHFVPDPDYGRPVTATYEADGVTVEAKLLAFPAGLSARTGGNGLGVGRDGKLLALVGDGVADCHLVRIEPATGAMTDLGGVQAALPAEPKDPRAPEPPRHGWGQAPPFQAADGSVYFATLANPGRNYGVRHPALGGLFRWSAERGIEPLAAAPREYYCLLYGDPKRDRLFVLTGTDLEGRGKYGLRILDCKSGRWQDLGEFPKPAGILAPFFQNVVGSPDAFFTTDLPADTTRFDLDSGKFLSAKVGPWQRYDTRNGLKDVFYAWLCAITADGRTAYLTARRWGLAATTELHAVDLSRWPGARSRRLADIDPQGRIVYANNLSLTPDSRRLVVVGTCLGTKDKPEHFQAIWAHDLVAGTSALLADIGDLLVRSFKDPQVAAVVNQYTNNNAVTADGWIWLTVRKTPESFYWQTPDVVGDLRLMAVRVTAK